MTTAANTDALLARIGTPALCTGYSGSTRPGTGPGV